AVRRHEGDGRGPARAGRDRARVLHRGQGRVRGLHRPGAQGQPVLRALSAAALAVLSIAIAAAADAPDRGSIVVTPGDESTVTLRDWSLSYEYALYRQGTSPMSAPAARKQAADLYVGKKAVPVAGQTLEIAYDGTRVKEMTLRGADGKKTVLKVEAPAR